MTNYYEPPSNHHGQRLTAFIAVTSIINEAIRRLSHSRLTIASILRITAKEPVSKLYHAASLQIHRFPTSYQHFPRNNLKKSLDLRHASEFIAQLLAISFSYGFLPRRWPIPNHGFLTASASYEAPSELGPNHHSLLSKKSPGRASRNNETWAKNW